MSTVTLSGSQSAAITTDGSGNYSFAGLLANGSYNISPSRSGYNFAPLTFNNLTTDQTANFTATPP